MYKYRNINTVIDMPRKSSRGQYTGVSLPKELIDGVNEHIKNTKGFNIKV